MSYEFSLTPFHQPKVDTENGGDFRLSSLLVRFKVKRAVSPRTVLGLTLKYDVDDYEFSGSDGVGDAPAWTDVRRFGLGIPLFTRPSDAWSLGVTPTLDWLQEHGADTSESFSYGLSAFVSRGYGRDKALGLGAGVFRSVDDDTSVFPIVVVDWRFNEYWRLANPFEADVVGPAGLELSYRFNDHWHLGGGGAYRSYRFRLNDRGVAPRGVGKNTGIVGFMRLRRVVTSGLSFSIYAGVISNGKLEIEERGGNHLSSADYDPAPFAAVTLSGQF